MYILLIGNYWYAIHNVKIQILTILYNICTGVPMLEMNNT